MKLFTRRARKRQARRDNVGRLVKPGYLKNRPQEVGTGGVAFDKAIPRATVLDGADLR